MGISMVLHMALGAFAIVAFLAIQIFAFLVVIFIHEGHDRYKKFLFESRTVGAWLFRIFGSPTILFFYFLIWFCKGIWKVLLFEIPGGKKDEKSN